MPPPKAGKPLDRARIEVFRRWIAQGAVWKGHWAYLPLERPNVPDSAGTRRI